MGQTVSGDKRFSQVHIPRNKITDYLLNKEHVTGKGKAKFFTSIGFSSDKPMELEDILARHPQTAELQGEELSHVGTNYAFVCDITAPNGKVVCIVSVWCIEQEGVMPRFVTAYPAKRR